MRRIVVSTGKATPTEIAVGEEPLLLGRARECDVRLFDETASRRHGRIQEEGGRVVLEDLGSANGIQLNGEAVEGKAALFDGDLITIGSVGLRYLSGDGADRVTVAATPDMDRVEASLAPEDADPAADAGGDAARRLRFVCDGAAVCTDAADETELGEGLLALAGASLGADRATLVLLDGGGKERVVAARPPGAAAPVSRTLRRRVLEAGEAVLVRDALDDAVRREAASMVASRYRSTLAAPLKTTEGVWGFVALEALLPDRYGEEDLRALAAAARQAALALRNLRALATARAEVSRLSARRVVRGARLIGEAKALDAVRQAALKAAAVDTPVLVTGETGTGKELVARLVHEGGDRRKQPFVALNCAALVEGLLESELFGHAKGAFTGATDARDGRIEQAGKGTLFLDEVGDLPPSLQAKLLRVLSEGTYTRVGGSKARRMACRVVAATNQDLAAMVEAGTFRSDLYYRLAVLEIELPPLRSRGDDVLLIADAAMERLAAKLGRRVPRLAAGARDVLRAYAWPGNVRELMNVLERAVVLADGDTLTAADLPAELRGAPPSPAGTGETAEGALTLREAEARAVRAALVATGGKKGKAAELLGISWPTLTRKIREYGLD